MKLSVVLATYNESENLFDCLSSIQDIADEIVIVDGNSTDDTVSIAKKFKAKIIQTENKALFHINKQMAIDAAHGDWILQLDADERVTPALSKEIIRVIKDHNYNGYWLPRKNYFLGRFLMKGGVYPDYTLRLYRSGKGRLPQKDVHEQAVVEGATAYIKEPLIHMADTSFRRYLLRYNRYTSLLAKQLRDEGVHPSFLNAIKYTVYKPSFWFLKSYIRHKGFLDSWQGFVFSFFSAQRFAVGYYKLCKLQR